MIGIMTSIASFLILQVGIGPFLAILRFNWASMFSGLAL